jgi:hypothetical protein
MDLKEYIEIKEELYDNIFSQIDDDKVEQATLRFHYIKFNPNNEPKFNKLIEILIEHITHYSLSVSKRYKQNDEVYRNKMYREARNLFRNLSKTGELGEMILWFLLESVLKAPQVVAKMDLKTNPNDEIKGADGIHVNILNDDTLEIIFGESKLYKTLSNAISDAFNSIETFISKEQDKREYSLITTHFKWMNTDKQEKLLNFLLENIEVDEIKIKFAILIGFDWTKYKMLQEPQERQKLASEFKNLYKEKAKEIKNLTQKKLENFKDKQYEFDIFFLPFESVENMRDRFRDEL